MGGASCHGAGPPGRGGAGRRGPDAALRLFPTHPSGLANSGWTRLSLLRPGTEREAGVSGAPRHPGATSRQRRSLLGVPAC